MIYGQKRTQISRLDSNRYYVNIVTMAKAITSILSQKLKFLEPGYELYIVAFFIGLYADNPKPLNPDPIKRKGLGQPIMYWGNIENRKMRKAYPQLRYYMFIALLPHEHRFYSFGQRRTDCPTGCC